jgi:hypothetical protein
MRSSHLRSKLALQHYGTSWDRVHCHFRASPEGSHKAAKFNLSSHLLCSSKKKLQRIRTVARLGYAKQQQVTASLLAFPAFACHLVGFASKEKRNDDEESGDGTGTSGVCRRNKTGLHRACLSFSYKIESLATLRSAGDRLFGSFAALKTQSTQPRHEMPAKCQGRRLKRSTTYGW